jgi:hypothetical protein
MAVPAQYSGSGKFAVLDYVSDIAREGASSRLVRWQELRIPRCARDDHRKLGMTTEKQAGQVLAAAEDTQCNALPSFARLDGWKTSQIIHRCSTCRTRPHTSNTSRCED